jgi:hypothetical protein
MNDLFEDYSGVLTKLWFDNLRAKQHILLLEGTVVVQFFEGTL